MEKISSREDLKKKKVEWFNHTREYYAAIKKEILICL